MQIELLYKYGDLQLLSEVDQLPLLEVPYPNTNGGQQFRRASGTCPTIPLHKCWNINCEEHGNLCSTRLKYGTAAFEHKCQKKRSFLPSRI